MNYRLFDDAILLKLLKAGDGSALEEIYLRYSEMVFLAAYKKVRSKAVAEELVQNLFISLWVKRETAQIQNLPSPRTRSRHALHARLRQMANPVFWPLWPNRQ